MGDFSHLYAIEDRLDHEIARRDSARTPRECEWREHNIRMIEKEIAGEKAFLAKRGIVVPEIKSLTDDELMAELFVL